MSVSYFGDPIILNVNVISINPNKIPTGAVILREGGITLAVKHLENGVANFILPPGTLHPGVHELIVYHAGDKNFASSYSPIFTKEIIVE